MNTQDNRQTQTQNAPQKQSTENGEPVQVSQPKNNDVQTGPFEHSGETSRQTNESREEEATQKEQA